MPGQRGPGRPLPDGSPRRRPLRPPAHPCPALAGRTGYVPPLHPLPMNPTTDPKNSRADDLAFLFLMGTIVLGVVASVVALFL